MLLDLVLPQSDGLDFIRDIHDIAPNLPVIVVRELENVIRKLTVLRVPDLIARELLEKSAARGPLSASKPGPISIRVSETGGNGEPPILEQVIKAKEQAESEDILSALNSTH